MAYTKIIAIRSRLDVAINYVLNDSKTNEDSMCFQNAVNCSINKAFSQMKETKDLFGSKGIIQGYHIIQSFTPNETNAKTAFEIAGKFVHKYLNDYEAVYSTHVDKDHVHNHIVFSSTSFTDGRKYRSNISTYYNGVRKTSDDICREYGLSIIEPNKDNSNLSYAQWLSQNKGKTSWRTLIKNDLDYIISNSYRYGRFLVMLEHMGYDTKEGKYLSIRPFGKERFVRTKSFGQAYTLENIKNRIDGNEFPIYDTPQRSHNPKPIHTIKFMPDIEKRYWAMMYRLKLVKEYKAPPKASKYLKSELLKFDRLKKQGAFLRDNNIVTDTDFIEFKSNLEKSLFQAQSEIQPIKKDIQKHNPLFKALKEIKQYSVPYEMFLSGHSAMKDEYDRYIAAVSTLESKEYSLDKLESIKDFQIDLYDKRSNINGKIQRIKSDLKTCANIVYDMERISSKLEKVDQRKKSRYREKER